jgi:hypothetical protein
MSTTQKTLFSVSLRALTSLWADFEAANAAIITIVRDDRFTAGSLDERERVETAVASG